MWLTLRRALLTRRLVGYYGHFHSSVNYYVPHARIRAEMVSGLVYGTYKCFIINVAELCPSLHANFSANNCVNVEQGIVAYRSVDRSTISVTPKTFVISTANEN